MKAFALLLVVLVLALSGCMTATVMSNAQQPKESDSAPWANYLLLPVTIPADVATSPIQLMAFVSYARGERPHVALVPISEASTTNPPTLPKALVSPKEASEHD
jgi:uncharacterized membrane protein